MVVVSRAHYLDFGKKNTAKFFEVLSQTSCKYRDAEEECEVVSGPSSLTAGDSPVEAIYK